MIDEELRARKRAARKRWRENNPERARACAREGQKRFRENNPERARAAQKRWRENNPEKVIEHSRKKRLKTYGLTLQQWDALFTSQGNKCAACGSDEPGSKQGWHTDHCHTSGVVRGVLCYPCNLALGHAREDAARLRALADYIDQKPGASSSNASGATSSSEPSS